MAAEALPVACPALTHTHTHIERLLHMWFAQTNLSVHLHTGWNHQEEAEEVTSPLFCITSNIYKKKKEKGRGSLELPLLYQFDVQ